MATFQSKIITQPVTIFSSEEATTLGEEKDYFIFVSVFGIHLNLLCTLHRKCSKFRQPLLTLKGRNIDLLYVSKDHFSHQ